MDGPHSDPTASGQEDLHDSASRLRLALDASGIAIWELDFSTGEVLLDSNWPGLPSAEPRERRMPFRKLIKLFGPEGRDDAIRQMREITRGERSDYRVEQRVRHRSGKWVWVESRGLVVSRNAKGGPLRMVGTAVDISHRKETEAAHVRQKEFLEALHQTALDLLARHEMADLLQAIVERSCALLDAPFGELSLVEGDELVVRAFTKNQPFLQGDRIGRNGAALSWRVHDTGEFVVVDDYSQHRDRRAIYDERPVRAAAIFPILHGSRCLGVLGLSRMRPGHTFSPEEIQRGAMLARQAALVVHNAGIYDDAVRETETRTVALRESEERFRAVFDKSPIIISLITLPEGRFVEVNAAGLAAFGIAREEIVGRTSADLGLWVDPAARRRYIDRLILEGGVSGFEADLRRKNGEIFTVVFSGNVIRIGGQSYCLNTVQDITVQKQAMERLRQSHKIELLGNLAGGIAHDFNNILTGILSNVDLARLDLAENHPARPSIDRIRATAGHAKNLVQQILTFSRMEEGKLVPKRLQSAVRGAVQLMRTTIPSMMRVEADISEDCPPVMADETQIHQVVMNLCTNAWHALPEHGGSITVSLQPSGSNVVLTVRDNGCGMDSATLQRIFEPFFTTKDTGKGTGLGLSVTHGIVKSHGGVIHVESAPGQGSVFEISLPAIVSVPFDSADAPKPSLARGRNEHLLFVDDETDVGEPLTELLKRLGYRVTYESDPRIALSVFQSNPSDFDLVITDLAMPGMTGRELAKEIGELRQGMRVILLTGRIEPKQREHLLQTGVFSVLTKPASLSELLSVIAEALNSGVSGA